MPQIIVSRDELQQRVNDGAHLVEVLPAKEFARAQTGAAGGSVSMRIRAFVTRWAAGGISPDLVVVPEHLAILCGPSNRHRFQVD